MGVKHTPMASAGARAYNGGQAPYVDLAPEKVGSIDPLDSVAPRPLGPQVYSVQQQVCAKFYTDRLRFGSTRVKNLFFK